MGAASYTEVAIGFSPVTALWAFAAMAALAWPSRIAGPLDGFPLDGVAKAVLIGVLFPSLLWFHARFVRTRFARTLVVVLLASKAVGAAALAPDGWCVRFEPQRPLVRDARSPVPHSWDVRADWLADEPACSAIMRRAYTGIGEFPVWFFNLPPAGDDFPLPEDRPPGARTRMSVSGFLHVDRPGVVRVEMTREMGTTAYVDGVVVGDGTTLSAGTHRVWVDGVLSGEVWRFIPTWNGGDLWATTIATVRRPSAIDLASRPLGGWIVSALVLALLGAWTASFARAVGSWVAIAWSVAAGAALAWLGAYNVGDAQWGVCALAGAAALPLPSRTKNVRGAFVLVGIPWLALIVANRIGQVGRFIFYTAGDDFWSYQRFGYRIVMQGYWLEGGTKVFYFQPFYRWMGGLLHLAFGDSSVGEVYWDAACLLATALLSFYVTRRAAGFRWGLAAAAATLGVVSLGAPWGLVGRGLSEITSAGFLYVGAFMAVRSRRGSAIHAALAGVFATLAFYTRLNNLPMAIAVACFGLSLAVPARCVWTPWGWGRRMCWRTPAIVWAVLAAGLTFFAWRNWHYSGVFSVFYGTQRNIVALWQPGITVRALALKIADSVAMVLSVHDPPAFDWHALPVPVGALAAVLAILGAPKLRDLPAAGVFFFLFGISAAFVARGWTYQGRFSVHVIGITCALATAAAANALRSAGIRPKPSQRLAADRSDARRWSAPDSAATA
jgi:hypothetical protein